MIKALLWDIDGVFVDTEEIHFRSWQWLVEREGGLPLTLTEYIPCVGHSGVENVQRIATLKNLKNDLEEMRLSRRKKFEELREEGLPILEENIKLLKNFVHDFPHLIQVVVSAASKADIERNLKAAGINNLFTEIISFEENGGMKRKPAPDMYLLALERLGLSAAECLAFEDTESGILSATAAGIRAVALPDRLTAEQNFSPASLILQSGLRKDPKEILAYIQK